MKSSYAALLLCAVSVSAAAAPNWLALDTTGDQNVYFDERFLPVSGPARIARVLRAYERPVNYGTDPVTQQSVYPHQSVKMQYVANCSLREITLYAWEMYTGNQADGELILSDSQVGAAKFFASSQDEEDAALALMCGADGNKAVAQFSE